jgi:hypothetical protein
MGNGHAAALWLNLLANPMSALLAGKLQTMIYPIHEQDHTIIQRLQHGLASQILRTAGLRM